MKGRERKGLSAKRNVRKILLVEDNTINQEIMLNQPISSDYIVYVASDGKEGLEKFNSGDFDLVLTDIEMPEMNG